MVSGIAALLFVLIIPFMIVWFGYAPAQRQVPFGYAKVSLIGWCIYVDEHRSRRRNGFEIIVKVDTENGYY